MENAGRVVTVGRDEREMGEGIRMKQSLASKDCDSDEKGFGGIETLDRRGSTT